MKTGFSGRWINLLIVVIAALAIPVWLYFPRENVVKDTPEKYVRKNRTHVDHSHFFKKTFVQPQDVTKSCLRCHEKSAKEVMKTVHWTWLIGDGTLIRNGKPLKVGKRNLVNNF